MSTAWQGCESKCAEKQSAQHSPRAANSASPQRARACADNRVGRHACEAGSSGIEWARVGLWDRVG
eukprot:880342-Rhodomonas_salina.4